jgi:ABC-type branched-subunit amino acid transport system substrate-binding protein
VGRERPAFDGATGEIRLDANGNAAGKPVLIARVGS